MGNKHPFEYHPISHVSELRNRLFWTQKRKELHVKSYGRKSHFENGREKTSENLLLHKSNEIAKIIEIFAINQWLPTIWNAFTKEKCINLGQNCGLFNSPYSHLPLPSSLVVLKTNNLTMMTAITMISLEDTGGGTSSWLSKSPIPRQLPLFHLSGSLVKTCTHSICLYMIWLKSLLTAKAFSLGHLPKTISDYCLK